MNKYMISVLVSGVLLLTLSACEEQGSAEKAGEKIDNLTQDIGNQFEDACENVKDEMNAEDSDC